MNNHSILRLLAKHYPGAKTSLNFRNPYELFVATVLSAQTTDQQVNRITKKLFADIPTVYDLSHLTVSDLGKYLKSCGLYRNKSKYLIEASRQIVENYNGQIPANFDQLIALPGVGRKTASVIISSAFGIPALAVDTHVFRVSRRLGLACGTNVNQVEEQLKKAVPIEEWVDLHHRLIFHGRQTCHARKPDCEHCFLIDQCLFVKKGDIRCDMEEANA